MVNKRITRRRFVASTLAGGAGVSASFPSSAAASVAQGAVGPARPWQRASDSTIAITDVTVIDATGAPPLPHMTVVIEGERISEIRPTNADRNPEGTHIVDGTGRFLIPGLWDAHVHTFVFPWQPDLYFPLLIANGITGIRDMGGPIPCRRMQPPSSPRCHGF